MITRTNIIITMVLAVAALLPSCQKNETSFLPERFPETVGFGVYSRSTFTKGTEEVAGDIYGTALSKGIGVFAFLQPNVSGAAVDFNSRKFPTPDFMYNQKVGGWNGASGSWSWTYSPVKFWPSEVNDRVSFFAYAPYSESTRWEDLSIATNSAGTILTASVPVHDTKPDMKDVLWAAPVLNSSRTHGTVSFSFRHLLSKVSIMIGVDDGTIPAGPKAWTDPNTTISVDKIVFTSLSDSYNLSCPLNPAPSDDIWKTFWTSGGSTQNVSLTRSSGFDFDIDSSLICSANYTEARYYTLLKKEDGREAFLFLAPQTFTAGEQTVSVTYTVTTTDTVNPSNSSRKTNVVTRDLSAILPSGLTSGRAYVLKFLLNPASVTLSGSMTGWNSGSSTVTSF